jgi:hypothetical protein
MAAKLRHILFNMDVPGSPAAIIVRIAPMPWRAGVLPVIKKVAEDIAGRKVRWADIFIHENMGDTPEQGEAEWLGFVERKTQCLYRCDAPGVIERVN